MPHVWDMGRGGNSSGKGPMASGLLYGPSQPRHTAKVEKIIEEKNKLSIREQEDELFSDVLDLFANRAGSTIELAASIPLHAPASPTDKGYQGYVFIKFDQMRGEAVFTPLCKYGPGTSPRAQISVEKAGVGTDIDKALRALNKKLAAKQKGKGRSQYVPVNQSQSMYAEITRADVAKGAADLLKRPPPGES
jgi:hypothetical protein